MKQYEYKVVQVSNIEEAEAVLNEWGKQGWQFKNLEHFFINIWDNGIILTLEKEITGIRF